MIQAGPPPVASTLHNLGGRNILGWFVLAIFFALSIATAFVNSTSPESPRNRVTHQTQQALLQSAMSHKWFQLNTRSKSAGKWNEQADPKFTALDPEIARMKIAAARGDDPMATKLYAAMSFERGKPINLNLLQPLETSKKKADFDVWTIYASTSLSRDLAQRIVDRLPNSPTVYKVAKVHALEKAGVHDSMAPFQVNKVGVELGGLLSMAMMAAWIPVILFCVTAWRAAPALGIPMDNLSPRGADRLAIHAAVIVACFQLVSILALYLPLGSAIAEMVAGFCLIGLIVLLQRVGLDGIKVSLAEMGVSAVNLKNNLLAGFVGFLAEIPIAVLLAAVGEKVFKFLPTPSHPVSQALEATHKFSIVFPLIIFGSFIAPFWEELTFRGLLFPALRRFIGFIPSILVSSLLFGLIHPQGPALVLSLAWVGVASCILSYRTKSLVPSMVMHCLHNSAIFALTLLIS